MKLNPTRLFMHLHMPTKKLKIQKYLTKLLPLIKAIHLKEEGQLQDGAKHQGMKIDLMAIVIIVMDWVTGLWIVHSMKEEVLEVQITQ